MLGCLTNPDMELVGHCLMCKKPVFRGDLSADEKTGEPREVYFYKGWPGSGLLCHDHPGAGAAWLRAVLAEEQKLQKTLEKVKFEDPS